MLTLSHLGRRGRRGAAADAGAAVGLDHAPGGRMREFVRVCASAAGGATLSPQPACEHAGAPLCPVLRMHVYANKAALT